MTSITALGAQVIAQPAPVIILDTWGRNPGA
jgi:hypothetical protein